MSQLDDVRKTAVDCVNQITRKAEEVRWDDPETYAAYLAQTYYYVRHATRVLTRAASHCSLEDEELHKRLLHGVNEEKDHEMLALKDLRALGFDIGAIPEYPETSAYYQTLYHNISADGPYALMGFFIPLEGVGAIGFKEQLKAVQQAYPKNATTFLKVHCTVDQRHFGEALEALEGVAPAQLEIVRKHLVYSTELFVSLLDGVIRRARSATALQKKVA